jgi:hypothetical protein
MTRAAFVSSTGEPFILSLIYRLFKERWYDEVEALYININNHSCIPSDVLGELIGNLIKDYKVHIIFHYRGVGNGPPFTELTKISTQDLVLMLEDDGFIFDSGAVDHEFQQIESDLVDAAGSSRFSCGAELGEAVAKKYGLDYSGYGDRGPNFWPCFFFCKRSDLLKTDLDFGSHVWEPGFYEPLLDHTFNKLEAGDTFVWLGVQLRALGLRFNYIPQHHADPYEVESKGRAEGNWHIATQPFHWIHAGSLSSGWNGYLTGRVPDTSTDISKREIETRVAFWKLCMEETDGFEAFKISYIGGIQNLVDAAKLDWGRIDKKIELYRKIMKL